MLYLYQWVLISLKTNNNSTIMKNIFLFSILFSVVLSSSCSKMDFSRTENVWLESMEKQKLIPTDVIAFKAGMEVLSSYDSQVDVSKYPGAFWAVKAGKYIISTGFYTQGRYKLENIASGETGYFLQYPDHPKFPKIDEETKAIMYASNVLRLRPDNEAFVCGTMYSGVLEICKIQNDQIFAVKQLNLHYPKVYIQKSKAKDKYPTVAFSRDNFFGFTDIFTTQDRIYTIYSGKTFRENQKNIQEGSFLMVFDWNGNLLKSFELSVPLTLLKYNEEEKAIFGQRFRENYLIKYLLP